MRSLFLLAGFVIYSILASAQIGWGPEIGLNISNYVSKSNGKTQSTSPKYGGMFGGVMDIELSDHFYLLPGLYYYRNGYLTPFYGDTKTVGINTFELPLSLEYKFGPPTKVKLFVGAGVYVSANQGGSVILSLPVYSTRNINIGYGAADDIKTFDFGVGAFGLYQLTRGLFFRARYQQGLLNMAPKTDLNNSLVNYSISLSLGYVFPGNKKAKNEPAIEMKREEEKQRKIEEQKAEQRERESK
jgi:hypothetical protein